MGDLCKILESPLNGRPMGSRLSQQRYDSGIDLSKYNMRLQAAINAQLVHTHA